MLSYADAGVDIDTADQTVDEIASFATRSHRKGVMAGVGGFASLFNLKEACPDLREPILVSGTDGVGTKLLVAIEHNRFDTIGQDLVAMCANDVLTTGANPLFFLDYFATGKLSAPQLLDVVQGISKACAFIDCALVGGETAEMPGLYAPGHFDLAGFCVGVVDRHRLIDGAKIAAGDQILGLNSSGLHSNGFSLVRKIVGQMQKPIDPQILLEPTRLYVNQVQHLLENGAPINAMAHITGGGLMGNIERTIPKGLSAQIDFNAWKRPDVFNILQNEGPVLEAEMQKTFNLGIGFTMVVPKQDAAGILATLKDLHQDAQIIGEII